MPAAAPHFTHDPSLHAFHVPPAHLLATLPALDRLAVGGYIFSASGRVLLLRRAPTDTHGLTHEPPGGGADAADATLLHALAREVREETGLVVRHIAGFVGAKDFVSSRGWRVRKFAFVVEVEGEEGEGYAAEQGWRVTVNPEEHCEWGWYTREEVAGLEMTGTAGEGELEAAFEMWRARAGGGV